METQGVIQGVKLLGFTLLLSKEKTNTERQSYHLYCKVVLHWANLAFEAYPHLGEKTIF